MDSGIDQLHPQFRGIKFVKFTESGRVYNRLYEGPNRVWRNTPTHEHGTSVASVLLSKDYGAFRATSQETRVIDVRVGRSRYPVTTDIINAYDKIIVHRGNHQQKKCIINMCFSTAKDDTVSVRLERLANDHNCIMIASAGNRNRAASEYLPASSEHVITVGAIDKHHRRWISDKPMENDPNTFGGSNYGDSVDIWAPGKDVLVATKNGGPPTLKSGTSVAAPLVTGVVANILTMQPTLTLDEIKTRLLKYAVYDVMDIDNCNCRAENLPRVQALCKEYCPNDECTINDEEYPTTQVTDYDTQHAFNLGYINTFEIETDVINYITTTFIVCEGSTARFGCNTDYTLSVEECEYTGGKNNIGHKFCGAEDDDDCAVIAFCNDICNGEQTCEITINNAIVNNNDPCPDISKYAKIKFKCDAPNPRSQIPSPLSCPYGTSQVGTINQNLVEPISATLYAYCDNIGTYYVSQDNGNTYSQLLRDTLSSNLDTIFIDQVSCNTKLKIECQDTGVRGGFIASVEYNGIKYSTLKPIINSNFDLISSSDGYIDTLIYQQKTGPPWNINDDNIDNDASWIWNGRIHNTLTFEFDFSNIICSNDISYIKFINDSQVQNIDKCKDECMTRLDCFYFSWSSINGDNKYPDVTVCRLYNIPRSTTIQSFDYGQILCSSISCPYGTEQIGTINTDIIGCGLKACNERFNTSTIEDCENKCITNSDCLSYSWAPINGDSLFPDKSVCTLYDSLESNGTRGPKQILCKSLSCPYGTIQIGDINKGISGCGLTTCDERYDVTDIEECRNKCNERSDCVSFSWAPINGDSRYPDKSVCSLFNTATSTNIYGPRQILCGSLSCPDGTTQIGNINADISGCGLTTCNNRYLNTNIKSCRNKCQARSDCLAFSWSEINGNEDYPDTPVCTIYDSVLQTAILGPQQILCKLNT